MYSILTKTEAPLPGQASLAHRFGRSQLLVAAVWRGGMVGVPWWGRVVGPTLFNYHGRVLRFLDERRTFLLLADIDSGLDTRHHWQAICLTLEKSDSSLRRGPDLSDLTSSASMPRPRPFCHAVALLRRHGSTRRPPSCKRQTKHNDNFRMLVWRQSWSIRCQPFILLGRFLLFKRAAVYIDGKTRLSLFLPLTQESYNYRLIKGLFDYLLCQSRYINLIRPPLLWQQECCNGNREEYKRISCHGHSMPQLPKHNSPMQNLRRNMLAVICSSRDISYLLSSGTLFNSSKNIAFGPKLVPLPAMTCSSW